MRFRLLGAVVASFVFFAGSGAHAADGAVVTGDATYDVRPESSTVHVTIDVSFTNVTTDRTQGLSILRTYYTGMPVVVPTAIANISASSGGARLNVSLEQDEEDDWYQIAKVSFSPLYSGQTRSFRLEYDIVSAPLRGDDPTRVNSAYASFLAFGVGDAGKANVRVTLPNAGNIETLGSRMTESTANGQRVYTANAIAEPTRFAVLVSARYDNALASIDADVGDRDIVVRSWPGDTAWQEFVKTGVHDGITILESLIGQPWPIKGQLKVAEASTPYLRGYAGWFLPRLDTIEVGEEIDHETLFHELAHVWFNDDLFAERWINEAFAEEYAAQTLKKLDKEYPAVETPKADDPGKKRLQAWSNPSINDRATRAVETYGYNTSAWLMRQLVDEIGVEGMAKVIDAAKQSIPAYGGTPGEFGTSGTRSERFLDLLEEVGGSTKAADIFKNYVFNETDGRLERRAEARTKLDQLDAVDGDWLAPTGIRRAMHSWAHQGATQYIDGASAIIGVRDQIDSVASSFGATASTKLRTAYETADGDMTDVRTLADEQLTAAREVAAAKEHLDKPRGVTTKIGLLFAKPQQKLDQARAAFEADDLPGALAAADALDRELDDAAGKGTLRLSIVVGSLLLLVILLFMIRTLRTRKRRRAAASAAATAAVTVAEAPATEPAPYLRADVVAALPAARVHLTPMYELPPGNQPQIDQGSGE